MRAGAFFAHPGHELRALGWCMHHRPKVFFLTNGQGSKEKGRMETSNRILSEIGCEISPANGSFSDREIYEAMMSNQPERIAAFFESVRQELAGEVREFVFDCVEGFNPSHDLVCLLGRQLARTIGYGNADTAANVLQVPMDTHPEEDARHPNAVLIHSCTDGELDLKLQLARSYTELAAEVNFAIEHSGVEAFRREWGRRIEDDLDVDQWLPAQPQFERYGQERVKAGIYSRALTRDDHVLPFFRNVLRLVHPSR